MRVKQRLRKSWYLLRRRFGANPEPPLRLVVKKATWLHDARSPVILMVDDLTNAWHSHRVGGSNWDHGGDWGGGGRGPGSVLRFFEERFLRDFPEAKVTFFTVAGPISAYTSHQPFSYAAPMDIDEESREFFRSLSSDPRFELAYHGFNHGTPGPRTEEFLQEWRGFQSREEAVAQTRRGLEIFQRATGAVPLGGKYGGWDYNDFADEVVDDCGFLWWCRDWTPRDVSGRVSDHYYDPQFFGSKLVVALPSTVHGYLWSSGQVDMLLARQQIIAVEEHIAPVRPDGLIQTPNIVDDLDELKRLFTYLRTKRVWHATGSQVASYIVAREQSIIYDSTLEGFSIRYEGRFDEPLLTLQIDCSAVCTPVQPVIEIVTPDGSIVDPAQCRFDANDYRHVVTVPVKQGRYRVRPRAQ